MAEKAWRAGTHVDANPKVSQTPNSSNAQVGPSIHSHLSSLSFFFPKTAIGFPPTALEESLPDGHGIATNVGGESPIDPFIRAFRSSQHTHTPKPTASNDDDGTARRSPRAPQKKAPRARLDTLDAKRYPTPPPPPQVKIVPPSHHRPRRRSENQKNASAVPRRREEKKKERKPQGPSPNALRCRFQEVEAFGTFRSASRWPLKHEVLNEKQGIPTVKRRQWHADHSLCVGI